jgi:hypothetical protein
MKNKHKGSSFEECNAEAIKRVLSFQLEKELKKQKPQKPS